MRRIIRNYEGDKIMEDELGRTCNMQLGTFISPCMLYAVPTSLVLHF
jgi:hypothetical protein